MCQASEGERLFMNHMDDFVTRKGWAAHRDGKPREYTNPLHDEAFYYGYDSRADAEIVPWAIVSVFRKSRERETGKRCFDEPTREQADDIVGEIGE